MASNRATHIAAAKLAAETERYDDMVTAMKTLVQEEGVISEEERNLLSAAYKSNAGERRSAWRMLSIKIQKGEDVQNAESLREKVGKELTAICQEIISLLEGTLIPKAIDKQSKVFYLKMSGDYYRYLTEIASVSVKQKRQVSAKAEEAYSAAAKEASSLSAADPMKLGLALNQAVFLYEIKSKPTEAMKLAKDSFEAGIKGVSKLKGDDYEDATLLLQLLRDNLTLWTFEQTGKISEQTGKISESKDKK